MSEQIPFDQDDIFNKPMEAQTGGGSSGKTELTEEEQALKGMTKWGSYDLHKYKDKVIPRDWTKEGFNNNLDSKIVTIVIPGKVPAYIYEVLAKLAIVDKSITIRSLCPADGKTDALAMVKGSISKQLEMYIPWSKYNPLCGKGTIYPSNISIEYIRGDVEKVSITKDGSTKTLWDLYKGGSIKTKASLLQTFLGKECDKPSGIYITWLPQPVNDIRDVDWDRFKAVNNEYMFTEAMDGLRIASKLGLDIINLSIKDSEIKLNKILTQ